MLNFSSINLGRYKLLERIHEDEKKSIFKAFDSNLQSNVIIEFFHLDSNEEGFQQDFHHFQNVIKELVKINNPLILPITDFGEIQHIPYVVMRYLSIRSFAEELAFHPNFYSVSAAVSFLSPVIHTFSSLHQSGFSDLWLTPSNLFISETEFQLYLNLPAIIYSGYSIELDSEYLPREFIATSNHELADEFQCIGRVFLRMILGKSMFLTYLKERDYQNSDENANQCLEKAIQSLSSPVKEFFRSVFCYDDKRVKNIDEFEKIFHKISLSNTSKKTNKSIITIIFFPIIIILLFFLYHNDETNSVKISDLFASITPTFTITPNLSLSQTSQYKATQSAIPTSTMTFTVTATTISLPTSTTTPVPKPISKGNYHFLVSIAEWQAENSFTGTTFSNDCQLLAGSTLSGNIQLWNVMDGKKILQFGDVNYVHRLAFSADKSLLASDNGSSIQIWDVQQGQLLHELDGKSSDGIVTALVFSPDGNILVSGHLSGIIHIWDISTNIITRTLNNHTDEITALVISEDGEKLFSGSKDKTVRYWNMLTGNVKRTISNAYHNEISSLVYLPSQNSVIAALQPSSNLSLASIIQTNLENGESNELSTNISENTKIAFSPNNDILAAYMNLSLRLYSIPNENENYAEYLRNTSGTAVTISSDGYYICAVSKESKIYFLGTNQ